MSSNWITLIPEDPRYVPDQAQRIRARDRFAEIAPDADEIEIKVSRHVTFFDCGANFERIRCPSCATEIAVEWWQERLDDDYTDDGFRLAEYTTPCCSALCTLHGLIYEWPQGLGQFSLEAMNPHIGELDERQKGEFEELLGTPLRVIYRHL